MEKFKNKFRIPSARAQWWDYGNNAAYFITICTKNMIHYFGEIPPVQTRFIASVEPRLIASVPGKIAESCWIDIPNQFPYAQLDSFVIMPNHIHGIIIINKPDSEFKNSPNLSEKQSLSDSIEVGGFAGSNNPMLNDNIPRIIRWFKGRCTFEIRKIQLDFKWQTRYYDRIIRNEQEYNRIKFYIENNIKAWKNDK
jgi:REP element-mobilizing transposase RayT